MSDNPAFNLVEALGPVLDPAQIIYFENEQTWRIVIDENRLLDLVYDPSTTQFVFEIGLGPIPEDRKSVVHELLLSFSYLWQRNGGVYVALDDEGQPVLLFRSAIDSLDVTRLQTLIGNLIDQAFRWQELIDKTPSDADGDRDPPGNLLAPGAILV